MKSKVYCAVLLFVGGASAWGQSPAVIDCESNAACAALVDQAQQQSKAGRLAEAEKSYKLAYEVSHDARLLFNIARVLDKRVQGPEAMKYYRQFIEAPVDDEAQKAKAREYVEQLEAKLASRQPSPSVPVAQAATQPIPAAQATTYPMPMSVAATTERKGMPVYKRGWFWGVVLGSAAAVGVGIGLGLGLSNRGPTVPGGTNTIEPTF